ncbi:hypothetical protein [Streptomyces sp. NPDC002156]
MTGRSIVEADNILSGFLINLSASTAIIVVTTLLIETLQDRRQNALKSTSAVMAYDKVEQEIRHLVGAARYLYFGKDNTDIMNDERLSKLSRSIDRNGRYWEFVWEVRKIEVEYLSALTDSRLAQLERNEAEILHEKLIKAAKTVQDVLQLHGQSLDSETHTEFVYIWQMLHDCWDSDSRQAGFIMKLKHPHSKIGKEGAFYMRAFFEALEESCISLAGLPLRKSSHYFTS